MPPGWASLGAGRALLTDAAAGGDVLALQEALQVADLEVQDGEALQRARGQRAAGRAHGAAAAPQARAAVEALAFRARPLAPEHTELNSTTFARHLTAPASSH